MNADQIRRLGILTEKLADVVLEEADPDNWSGKGVPIANMDQKSRGDRYWCKKNAAASMSLLDRAQSLLVRATHVPPPSQAPGVEGGEEPEVDIDSEISSYEAKAAKLLDKVKRGAKKATFDQKVHGK